MATSPFPPAPFATVAPGLRFHLVETRSRAPEIRPRDFVLVKPVSTYLREGDYLDVHGNLFICQHIGGKTIRMTRTGDGRLSSDQLSLAEFESIVVGYVVAVLSIKDHRAIREAAGEFD